MTQMEVPPLLFAELGSRLAASEAHVAEVERQNELLIAAVRSLIHAVGAANGLQGWRQLAAEHGVFRRELESMRATLSAEVMTLKATDVSKD